MACCCSPKKTGSSESLTSDDYFLEKKPSCTCRKFTIWSVAGLILLIFLMSIIIWVIIPVTFMMSLPFQTFMAFLPVNSPSNVDFNKPEALGLQGVYNFYIHTTDYYDNKTLTSTGAWLLLPEDEINSTLSTNIVDIIKNTKFDILIYFHGVLSNRAKAVLQYQELRKHFLVIATDPRGYGDSGINVRMSELGIANDHVQIYDWLKSFNIENDIYYWGHSLGSGMSARTLKMLKDQRGATPKGLILESSFTSFEDVVLSLPITRMFSWLSYFDATILKSFEKNGFHMKTKENILSVDCPVMILHTEDDNIVSYHLGEKLASEAKEKRKNGQGNITFHGIAAEYGLGHNDILMHPKINDFISGFKAVCRSFSGFS